MGTALAAYDGGFHALACAAALFGALTIQVGTNFCNDYFDYFQGADTPDRKGPTRAVASGLITPRQMACATVLVFTVTLALSLYLSQRAGWLFLVIGLASILFGVMYTAGKWSLAYMGLGDPFVLVFFGPVAVGGTYYVQTLAWRWPVAVAGLAPGLIAVGLLVANNLRDIEEDKRADKRTLAVRFGATFSRCQFTICLMLGTLLPILLWRLGYPQRVLWAALTSIPAAGLSLLVWRRNGRELLPCLGMTAGILLLYTLVFCIGLRS